MRQLRSALVGVLGGLHLWQGSGFYSKYGRELLKGFSQRGR